jgi:hypothetical protein
VEQVKYDKKWNKYDKKWKKSYKSRKVSKFYAPRYYSYKRPYYRRHDDNFAIGLGLGLLGAAILSAPYYQASGDWCHVHRYPVRGMTFHTDVRCFQHRNWNSPSIVYVR